MTAVQSAPANHDQRGGAHRRRPPPPRWTWAPRPRGWISIACAATVGLAVPPVMALATTAAPSPGVDVTGDTRPRLVPPVARTFAPAPVPSVGAVEPTGSAPAGTPETTAPASIPAPTATARPTATTQVTRTAVATIVITEPGQTATSTATTTATITATLPPPAPGSSPPPATTGPAEPTPREPVDLIDQVLDEPSGQETP